MTIKSPLKVGTIVNHSGKNYKIVRSLADPEDGHYPFYELIPAVADNIWRKEDQFDIVSEPQLGRGQKFKV
jgi:hypothetical protein